MRLPRILRTGAPSRRTTPAIVALSVVALVASACGSSSGTSASDGDIDVMAIGIFQSAELSLPDASAALKAHVSAVNDAGGINERKINLVVCNDKFDPNTAADCARQAARDQVVAVVSTYEPFSPQVDPILEAAGIPMVYNSVASEADTKSPISFPRDSGIQGLYGTLGLEMADAGCEKIGAVVTALANTQLGAKWLKKGAKSRGVPVVTTSVGQTQADFNAPVAKLLSQGVDCLVPATAPNQGPKIVTAVRQSGQDVRLGAVTSEFGSKALKTLGSAADGMILTGMEYRPTDTQVPAVKEVIKGMEKYQPNVPLTDKFGIAGWASITALTQLLKSINGDITAESVLAAVKEFSPDTDLYADFSYSDPPPDPDLPQVKNWRYLTWTVNGGEAKLDSQQFQEPKGLF